MKRKLPQKLKTIRTNLTFRFDETKIKEEDVKNRLDELLIEEFGRDVHDIHTRWVEKMSDSPLYGSANRRVVKPRGGGLIRRRKRR